MIGQLRRRPRGPGRLFFLLAMAMLVVFGLGFYLFQPPPRPDFARLQPAKLPSNGPAGAPSSPRATPGAAVVTATPASFEPPAATPAITLQRQPAPGADGPPRIAIIIDDLGRNVAAAERLAAINENFSFAVMPFESQTSQVVAALRARGLEILCHLPMEARGSDAGPGALTLAMGGDERRAATARALDAVPGAVGANNHMGSTLAADLEAMRDVLGVLQGRGLFFVDSRTSPDSVAYSVARDLGLAAAERQVFLDNERDEAAIARQLAELAETAKQRGGAVGIAHPYSETLSVLARELPRLSEAGFRFVRVSELLTR